MEPPTKLEFTTGQFDHRTIRYRKDHLIVKFKQFEFNDPQAVRLLDNIIGAGNYGIVGHPVGSWTYLWATVEQGKLLSIIETLDRNQYTEYAEPDLAMRATAAPNDPLLKYDPIDWAWGLDNMKMFRAWDIQAGTDDVVIGLLDSGVPLLKTQTPPELAEHADLDGYVLHEDLDGRRFIAGMDPLLGKRWPREDRGIPHGTNMAGIMAATPDNSLGLAGVNWGSPVFVYKAFQLEYPNPNESPELSSTEALIKLGVEDVLAFANESEPAKKVVFNISVSLYQPDEEEEIVVFSNTLKDIFNLIVESDSIVCIAAGNDGGEVTDLAKFGLSPENTYAKNVIVVGSVDENDILWEDSARGEEEMVFAPGVRIATTHEIHGYGFRTGTSQATPHATALAAVMWSEAPHRPASDIVRILKENCRDPEGDEAVNSFVGIPGKGIINAYDSLLQLKTRVCLVLDRSGSMRTASGIDGKTRFEIMKTAASDLVNFVDVGSSLGVVVFNGTAETIQPLTLIKTPETAADDGDAILDIRAEIITQINLLEYGGSTSIGAGVKEAREKLGASDLPQAIIVLTDGEENSWPYLATLEQDPNEIKIFAVGMGTEDTLQPDALMSLAEDYKGHMVLDDHYDNEDSDSLSKFLGQVIAIISDYEPVSDPSRRIHPGKEQIFQVPLGDTDACVEVILIRPAQTPLEMKIFPPTGDDPWPGTRTWTSANGRVTRCRFSLPLSHITGAADHYGDWRINVSLSEDEHAKWLKNGGDQDSAATAYDQEGVPFTLWVNSRSTTKMYCRIKQSGFTPGSTMTLHVELTQLGKSIPWPALPEVRVTGPNNPLPEVKPDAGKGNEIQFSIVAREPGIYRWNIVARGADGSDRVFQRERTLTGAVWNPTSIWSRSSFHIMGSARFSYILKSGWLDPTTRSS